MVQKVRTRRFQHVGGAVIPAGYPFRRCGPQCTHFKAVKHAHVGFLMFGSWYLARLFRCYDFGPWYRIYFSPSLDPLYLLLMVLSHGVNKGMSINREGDHLVWVSLSELNILRSEILGYFLKL